MTAGGTGPELLDVGPIRPAPGRRRLRLLAVLGTVAILLVVVAYAVVPRPPSATDARLPPGQALSTSPSPEPSARTRATQERAPVVLRSSGPGIPGFGDTDLFVRSADHVYRVGLATGRITDTYADAGTSASLSFLAGSDRVVLRPLDDLPGMTVPDGGPAEPLRGGLRGTGQLLPGPADRLWVSESFDGRSSIWTLTRFDGRPTSTQLRETGYFLADGAGGLLLVDHTGLYERRAGRWSRISSGSALAVGPHHILLAACDGSAACPINRYDRRTHALTPVPVGDARLYDGGGVISPDGRYVATMAYGAVGGGAVEIVDLYDGRVVTTLEAFSASSDVTNVVAWSPDGRLLAGIDDGRLVVLQLETGQVDQPDLGLPPLRELALRH